MDSLSPVQKLGLEVLMFLRVWPHVHFTYSPFKILEFRQLVERLPWTGRERVLDIGCGAGLQTFLIGRHAGHVTGLDINPDFVEQARWYGERVRGTGTVDFEERHLADIAYADRTFDRIFSICVLEHIPEHREILAECRRILKPGGEMVFSVDTLAAIDDESLRAQHEADHHVVQYYTPDGLRDLLLSSGFTDVTLTPLFRSDLARKLFVRGIHNGFNFGRFGASRIAKRLERAECNADPAAPEIFLAAHARVPASG